MRRHDSCRHRCDLGAGEDRQFTFTVSIVQEVEFLNHAGVLAELTRSLAMGRTYAETVFACIGDGRLQVVVLTSAETTLRNALPDTLGMGERESMAVAKERQGTVLSNESRVAPYCHQLTIPCIQPPDILRALWAEGVVSRQNVQTMIEDLQVTNRRRKTLPIRWRVLRGIFK